MACSELFVESVLDEVIQHPVGLKRRRGIKLGDALHHSFPKADRDALEAEMDDAGANWQMLDFGGRLHSFAEESKMETGLYLLPSLYSSY
jgi:hypothetical protein